MTDAGEVCACHALPVGSDPHLSLLLPRPGACGRPQDKRLNICFRDVCNFCVGQQSWRRHPRSSHNAAHLQAPQLICTMSSPGAAGSSSLVSCCFTQAIHRWALGSCTSTPNSRGVSWHWCRGVTEFSETETKLGSFCTLVLGFTLLVCGPQLAGPILDPLPAHFLGFGVGWQVWVCGCGHCEALP